MMQTGLISATGLIMFAAVATFGAASSDKLRQERELLRDIEIQADQLKPLRLDTELVRAGAANAVICHADAPAWRAAAGMVRDVIREVTGVALEVVVDSQLSPEAAENQHLILLGHLDNNRHVARLYHNFFVCLDVGFTGRKGYVIRSVHDPFGTGRNAILVGGSFAEGTARGAEAFAAKVREAGKTGELRLGRILELTFDAKDRQGKSRSPMTDKQLREDGEYTRKLFASPGRGRSGLARLIRHGVAYHRSGDLRQARAYRDALLAIMNYYATDDYINSEGLARYDRDFRDSWTHSVAITWDLLEESGLFSDDERLQVTNYLIRLGLECVLYQRWNRPDKIRHWVRNDTIVHNHNTFPALGVHFVGTYMKRHYGVTFADEWLTVAKGIFDGQKQCSKPLEDAASYQWLPLMHVMIYTMATGDATYFAEGHAAESAKVAQMVMDNAGYQAAFGDHPGYTSSSGIGSLLQRIGWQLRDPGMLWGARRSVRGPVEHEQFNLGQPYYSGVPPKPPAAHVGVTVATLPRKCYDYAKRSPQYATAPNLPWPETFDKITFRGGLGDDDEYLLLDGFGRGTHMHFDANAIIRFAAGGKPLLVDGEYIKNAPKYHNSLVILRNGASELTPAVTGLREAVFVDDTGITRSYLTQYNGAEWERTIVWRRGAYFLVFDTVTAQEAGDYTLRCCWRPWGAATLDGATLTADQRPMRLSVINADGAAQRLETMKIVHRLPVSRLSQQVSRSLAPGTSYQFVNVVHAESIETPRDFRPRKIADGVVTIDSADSLDLCALAPQANIPGIRTDASVLLLSDRRIVATACRSLSGEGLIVSCSVPVSLEIVPSEGTAVVVAGDTGDLRLRVGAGGRVDWAGGAAEAGKDGIAVLALEAGRHALKFAPSPADSAVAAALRWARQQPTGGGSAAVGESVASPLPLVWEHLAFDPPPEPLPIVKVHCDHAHDGRYGPLDKLTDGAFSSSTFSVKWPNGVTPTITAELAEDLPVTRIVLREWHMSADWDVAERTLEISSDGFVNDIRAIATPFKEAGKQRWGNNVNTLMAVDLNQTLKQARLVITPARDDSSVYLAEIEIMGTRPGRVPEVRALTSASFGEAEGQAVVAASASGAIRAFSANGEALWSHITEDQAPINTIACADVDGDGRDEIIYGANASRLGLLDTGGRERWRARPPDFRGIQGNVITAFPADVDGDGLPEIVCGCLNWQYFAYDAKGKMLWKNVIYAHSATVGCAVDLDADGKDEVIGGNAYYCLNIIDHDGKRLVKADRFGPEQTAAAAGDVDGDGQVEVLIGTDGGELICFASNGKRRWTANVGDKVTRIVCLRSPQDGGGQILCAAESAHVFCFTGAGETVWARSVGDGVSDLVLVESDGGQAIATAAGSEGIVVLDLSGKPIANARTAGRSMRLTAVRGKLVTTTDQGRIQAFAWPASGGGS